MEIVVIFFELDFRVCGKREIILMCLLESLWKIVVVFERRLILKWIIIIKRFLVFFRI